MVFSFMKLDEGVEEEGIASEGVGVELAVVAGVELTDDGAVGDAIGLGGLGEQEADEAAGAFVGVDFEDIEEVKGVFEGHARAPCAMRGEGGQRM